jgi:hypothetical protein
MQLFGITLETRSEKTEILKKVITSLNIGIEEKDLYILSLDILNDNDFFMFFDRIMSQIPSHKNSTREYSIEPLTSQII